MRKLTHSPVRVCALALSAVFATAGTAIADVATGGTSAPGSTGGTTTQAPATTSGANGLDASPRALKDRRQRVRGKIASASGTPVSIQLAGADGHWATVARTVAGGGGSIDTIWRPRVSGRFTLRAVPTTVAAASAASSATAAPTAAVTVYATAIATEYGPQAGDRNAKPEATACGPSVTATTLGVAHRTLPCGTLVELYYQGHTVTVPVIDRGPYANGASWDLTYATARALHFNGFDRVGSVVTGSVKLPTR
jgi:rare lipoprotein A (peptidoglycan hydrolase)